MGDAGEAVKTNKITGSISCRGARSAVPLPGPCRLSPLGQLPVFWLEFSTYLCQKSGVRGKGSFPIISSCRGPKNQLTIMYVHVFSCTHFSCLSISRKYPVKSICTQLQH